MSPSLEDFVSLANKNENSYNWLGAADFYLQAQGLLPEASLKAGEIFERAAFAFVKAAMQAEKPDEFKGRLGQATANYEKAVGSYSRLAEHGNNPYILRCRAMLANVGFWLASESPEKKRLIDECWQLTRDSLVAFEESGNALEYVRTHNQLALNAFQAYIREWDFQAGKRIIKQAVEAGDRAVIVLSRTDDICEKARAHVITAFYHSTFGYYFFPEIELKESFRREGQVLWLKANQICKEAALVELSRIPSAKCDEWGWSVDEMLIHYSDALECARETGDKFMIGTALDWLGYATVWKGLRSHDPDESLRLLQQAFQYAEETKKRFASISYVSARGFMWSGAPDVEYNSFVAVLETDMKKKCELLEKAVRLGPESIKQAESSGYPMVEEGQHHAVSKAQAALAGIEKDRKRKHWLLKAALRHRKSSLELTERMYPFTYWDYGVGWNYLADLELELSNFEKSRKKRVKMLQQAVAAKSQALERLVRELRYWEKIGELTFFAAFGYYQYSHGQMLAHLYELTTDKKDLTEAIRAFQEAAASYQKLDLFNRVGECFWKSAQGLDSLGSYLEAAEDFRIASENYKSSAEKIPQLRDFYQDYALYMEAWNKIEKARFYHARQEYELAREYFGKAANLHRQSRKWLYLASNYDAWAQVEHAEDLSRNEQSEAALKAFEKAAFLFKETKESLQKELDKTENPDERQMILDITEATEPRLGYSTARIAIEEAKIFDKKGEHYLSSEKYGSAAASLEKIKETVESEKDRKELELIATLSMAWQKMTCAEAEASSPMFLQASQLFEKVKTLSSNEKTKMLALAHSRFCRALAAGTKFADSRNSQLYFDTIRHLESASNYYLKAGFQNASEFARATELLFEAYVHIDDAKKENDPEKKAKLYGMAEIVLQASVQSFTKARHQEKRDQALALLDKIRKERKLATSLSEILHTPSAASTTSIFASPPLTHEKAVGLDRFEHADIQASVAAPQEIGVGEEFDVRLDIVNVAKGFGLLLRVDQLVPTGFKVIAFPPEYTLQDGTLEIRGRRLDPLKTESIKLTLEATTAGSVNITPRLAYVDDLGKFKTCKPDPVSLTVYPELKFEFKTEDAQKAFGYLIKSFTEDYMRRRLPVDKSGWRTLMDIVKNGKIPQYSAYGRGGHRGKALSELERRGLVEERVFPGERGRGGQILKLRVCYEKETVKRQIDNHVMKIA